MTKEKFLADDRFGRLTQNEISCSGGSRVLALRRLLDDERDDSFEAILDTDGETVWTPLREEDGNIVRDEDDVLLAAPISLPDFKMIRKRDKYGDYYWYVKSSR